MQAALYVNTKKFSGAYLADGVAASGEQTVKSISGLIEN